jgi:molybdate-binding protein/DNA-binding XRE family transcriptional regulator
MGSSPQPSIRQRRLIQGWSQAELAKRVGVSRQALNAIEGGHARPSIETAIELARALGCTVEALFVSEAPRRLPAPPPGSSAGSRFWLAEVRGRISTHRLDGSSGEAADAVVARNRRFEPLGGSGWSRTLLLAGCDPALRILGLRAGNARWLQAGTGSAVEMFLGRQVHLAGVHSLTERDQRRVRGAVLIHLATWPLGLAVRRGNPLGVRSVADLGRPEVRLINRERGASARLLLERLLADAGLQHRQIRGFADEVRSHAAIAQAVALGAADAGLTTQAAAAAAGLEFRQLSEESFNLLVDPGDAERPQVRALLATARSEEFRRDVGSLPGYGTSRSGQLVGEA